MNFDDEGFLSPAINAIQNKCRETFSDLFSLCTDINRLAHVWKFKCGAESRDGQKIIVICLFWRVLSSFASAVRLAEVGLCHDAEGVNRIALEAVFYIKRCSDSYEFVHDWVKSFDKIRLKLLRIAKDENSSLREILVKDEVEFNQLFDELSAQVKADGLEEIRIEKVARDAGLQGVYDYAYRHLSMSVHPTSRLLDRYVTFSADQTEITGFTFVPESNRVPAVLFTAITTLMLALEILADFYKIDKHGLSDIQLRFDNLNEKYKAIAKPS